MGLLDGLLGNVLGGLLNQGGGSSSGQGSGAIVQMALQLLQQNGGIGGVVEKLRQAGYGAQADSWVGTGANQPIPADALQQALGSGQLSDLATRLGVSRSAAAGGLASMLPQIIDQLTPHGQIPDNHNDMIEQAMAMLQKGRTA